MPSVWLMTGLPGSGKTTIAKSLGSPLLRFNLDDYRAMMGVSPNTRSKDREAAVQDAMVAGVVSAVDAGRDVVIDNTHLWPKLPSRYRKALLYRDVTFRVYDLTHVPVQECIARDAARDRSVGEDAIRGMWQKHQGARARGWQLTAEWMNEWNAAVQGIEPYANPTDLPPCVIFDIDGTLALHNGRNPYDFERCEEDLLNTPVYRALIQCWLAENRPQVILLSGRKSEVRQHTNRWLTKMGVPRDALHMRPLDDNRPDWVVKAELFDQHIRGRFHVEMIYDDRNQVVDLWRKVLKLPCAQVAEGNF